MPFKTKQGALQAARTDMGPEAVEAVDFQLRNTGAGWIYEPIPAANAPARTAQRKRLRRPLPEVEICEGEIVSGHARAARAAAERRPVVCRDVKTGEQTLKMAVPKADARKSTNRAAAAKSGHAKRGAAKVPVAPTTKTELLMGMMRTAGGATSKAMEEAASWAPHSVRGLVGSLKKRGIPVESLKAPGQPVRYRIAPDDVGDVI